MLRASCSSQLKVWEKGAAFKTSFSFARNCMVFPDCLLQFARGSNKCKRAEMSPAATQSKAWGQCPDFFCPWCCSRQARVLLDINFHKLQWAQRLNTASWAKDREMEGPFPLLQHMAVVYCISTRKTWLWHQGKSPDYFKIIPVKNSIFKILLTTNMEHLQK